MSCSGVDSIHNGFGPQGFGSNRSNTLREGDCVAGELEGVLYIQSLILFAPQAVPAEAHLPMLLPPLASRHPALRRAAAATLRHLAEKSPSVMLPARLEKLLFNALDAEVDGDIGAHIQVPTSDVMIRLCWKSASLAYPQKSSVMLSKGSEHQHIPRLI